MIMNELSTDSTEKQDSATRDSSPRREHAEEEISNKIIDSQFNSPAAQIFEAYYATVFRCLNQTHQPRYFCLCLVTNPWFERISMLIILINCITLGMHQPCVDDECVEIRCKVLDAFDHIIFLFFTLEMIIKVIAMGLGGNLGYFGDGWNRLDAFIVLAGSLEYIPQTKDLSLTAIRTIRVLRPLRAINRIPSMRILVMLLLDTLPMLGNVLLLCFFVFFIFGIIGVQLWAGKLRYRCKLDLNSSIPPPVNVNLTEFYKPFPELENRVLLSKDFICSETAGGMQTCNDVPPYIMYLEEENSTFRNQSTFVMEHGHSDKYIVCNRSAVAGPIGVNLPSDNSCVNWNQYYRNCSVTIHNPYDNAINFDNIGFAWVAIFQVISLESWVDIMYYIQDAHSYWVWIYFVSLIVIGTFFMLNLCLVVIATQFSETKKRETERMLMERRQSCSTLTSSDPTGCYGQMIKAILRQLRKLCKYLIERYGEWRAKSTGQIISPNVLTSSLQARRHKRRRKNPNSATVEAFECQELINEIPPPHTSIDITKCQTLSQSDILLPTTMKEKLRKEDNGGPLSLLTIPLMNLQHPTQAPQASPEMSEIDALNSPRRPTHLRLPSQLDLPRLSDDALSGSRRSSWTMFHSQEHDVFRDRKSIDDVTRSTTKNNNKNKTTILTDEERDENHSKESNSLQGVLKRINQPVKKLVNHHFFQRAILCAILINTMSMGIEYHDQPKKLTDAIEYSNYVFCCIFLLEMILKIVADGIFSYISEGFNLFDALIVILSLVELFHGEHSGLSVLRTFRLLRILKLVRFLPALREQFLVMLTTMDNVATFFGLLLLFIFVFSILGMTLFGGKFCFQKHPNITDKFVTCTCAERARGICQCDRANFDTLLWSLVTVFQILTQEDWNKVLYAGMNRTSAWAALYFIFLMTFGNYVLFNLLVAILVEGFSTDKKVAIYPNMDDENDNDNDVEKMDSFKRSASFDVEQVVPSVCLPTSSAVKYNHNLLHENILALPPTIMHTAATPMPTPQGSPRPESITDGVLRRNYFHAFNRSHFPTQLVIKENMLSVKDILNSSTLSITSMDRSSLRRSSELSPKDSHLQLHYKLIRSKSEQDDEALQERPRRTSVCHNRLKNSMYTAPNLQSNSTISGMTMGTTSNRSLHSFIRQASLHLYSNGTVPLQDSHDSEVSSFYSGENLSRNSSFKSYRSISPQNVSANMSRKISGMGDFRRQGLNLLGASLEERILKNVEEALIDEDNEDAEDFTCDTCTKILPKPWGCLAARSDYSLYIFSKDSFLRIFCHRITSQTWFDYVILFLISLNCITLAMERPSIPPESTERQILNICNYIFTCVFTWEMSVKVLARGLIVGEHAYFRSGWNIMDGFLVIISIIDLLITLAVGNTTKIFGILRVFRLLRTLRPLRVISRAPGLKLVVQTLLSSLKPIGNIVLICCTFFIIFGILGVQLFKGKFYFCDGPSVKHIVNKTQCINDPLNQWKNRKYNFDNLGLALMALFVLSSKDGWVQIMYYGLDAKGVDLQPEENYNEWLLLYFISFLLLVGFFVLNMFVGVVVENFNKCRANQIQEERARRAVKLLRRIEKKQRRANETPFWTNYSKVRLCLYHFCTSKYFDLIVAGIIGVNVISMAAEFYMMPKALKNVLKICNYFFTSIFIIEAVLKNVALGLCRYFKDRWNQVDIVIVLLSIFGIIMEEFEQTELVPINPTIIRVMRVLRIARVLKLLKMAKGIRSLLNTVLQALPQVGNLGLLFFLLFFIFAALGVEIFGRIECSVNNPCLGLGRHAHFEDFGMAYLTLFRIATGDNWNAIMKDTLRENCDPSDSCVKNCCVSQIIAPIYFVLFVLMAQFVLVNVVVAVLMKHLQESN